MEYSKYQQDIFEFIKHGTGHGIVEAVAGSGKTTTIIEALKLIPPIKRTLFVAFNKHIAEELEKRVPPMVEAKTLHSLGWAICRKHLGYTKMNARKIANIIKYKMFDMDDKEARTKCYKIIKNVCRLVSLCKAYNYHPKDPDIIAKINKLCRDYGIDSAQNLLIESTMVAFTQSCEQEKVADFDDMIYWPVYKDVEFPKYDYVFVDEAQDLSPIQQEFILRLMSDGGRIIAVGDTHQAIYGFRGASPDAMKKLKEVLHATELPLSICYRCGTSIVKAAKKYVPYIEASDTAKVGKVETIEYETFYKRVNERDYVLCRVTADLVKGCLALIRNGKKAMVKGREIGEGLLDFTETIGAKDDDDIDRLKKLIDDYANTRREKLKGREAELMALEDRCDTLRALTIECSSVYFVRNKIKEIFSNKEEGVVFSTIHKSKGLEADTIYIIRPDLLPHPKAVGKWQRIQEDNLAYVAITRAKSNLVWVTKGD